MTESNIFSNLFHSMIENYKEMYIRMEFVSNDKNSYKIYQELSSKLDSLKNYMKNINDIIEDVNTSLDDIYARYGSIDSVHPDLIVNTFAESQSDCSFSEMDGEITDLDNSTISLEIISRNNSTK